MSVYVVAQIDIHDVDEYQIYLDGFRQIFERYNGEMLAVDPKIEMIEGAWAYPRIVIMKFSSAEEARRWHGSVEFQALAQHRWRSAKSKLALVRGVDEPGLQWPA